MKLLANVFGFFFAVENRKQQMSETWSEDISPRNKRQRIENDDDFIDDQSNIDDEEEEEGEDLLENAAM